MNRSDFESKFLSLDDESGAELPTGEKRDFKDRKNKKKKDHLKSKKLRRYLIITTLVIVVVGLLVMSVKAGIVTVPLLTPLFYKVPQPTRVIELPLDNRPDASGQGSGFDQASQVLSITLNEEVLTYLLRQWQSNSAGPILSGQPQVVITKGELELYGMLLKPFRTDFVIIKLQPNFDSATAPVLTRAFQVTKFQIGNLNLPAWIGNLIVKEYLESSIKKLTARFGIPDGINFSNANIRVTDIILKEKLVTLNIFIDVKKIQESLQQLPQLLEQLKQSYPNKAIIQ